MEDGPASSIVVPTPSPKGPEFSDVHACTVQHAEDVHPSRFPTDPRVTRVPIERFGRAGTAGSVLGLRYVIQDACTHDWTEDFKRVLLIAISSGESAGLNHWNRVPSQIEFQGHRAAVGSRVQSPESRGFNLTQ